MKALLRRMTLLDRVILVALLLICLAAWWPALRAPAGRTVFIERDGQVLFRAPLSAERSVRVPGPLGPTVVEIRGGRVWISASSCPLHLCQRQGAIARRGELLACVPNRLLVRIAGRAETPDAYDLLSR
jgi:hypothetical protein